MSIGDGVIMMGLLVILSLLSVVFLGLIVGLFIRVVMSVVNH